MFFKVFSVFFQHRFFCFFSFFLWIYHFFDRFLTYYDHYNRNIFPLVFWIKLVLGNARFNIASKLYFASESIESSIVDQQKVCVIRIDRRFFSYVFLQIVFRVIESRIVGNRFMFLLFLSICLNYDFNYIQMLVLKYETCLISLWLFLIVAQLVIPNRTIFLFGSKVAIVCLRASPIFFITPSSFPPVISQASSIQHKSFLFWKQICIFISI